MCAFAQEPSKDRIAFATPNKDTLYVTNDDLGLYIKKVWDLSKEEKKPVIIATSDINAVANKYKKKKKK